MGVTKPGPSKPWHQNNKIPGGGGGVVVVGRLFSKILCKFATCQQGALSSCCPGKQWEPAIQSPKEGDRPRLGLREEGTSSPSSTKGLSHRPLGKQCGGLAWPQSRPECSQATHSCREEVFIAYNACNVLTLEEPRRQGQVNPVL